MGAIIFPKIIPNFVQILLKGLRILEFKIPNIKKTIYKIIDQTLISLLSNKGHKAIIKNITLKTNPKFLFEGILLFFSIIF